MSKDKKIAFFLMCLLVCLWGFDYVAAKNILQYLQPLQLMCLKYTLAFVFVLVLKLLTDRRGIIRKKDIPLFVVCSLTGVILYFLCEYKAMEYIPVSLITIVLAFVPVVSIIIERIVFKRKMTVKIIIGIMISIVGVAVVIGADFSVLLQGRAIGYLLAFGAVMAWNAFNFISESLTKKYNAVTMAANQLLCTVLLTAPYAICTMPPLGEVLPYAGPWIMYLGIFSAGCGYLIMPKGLKELGPTISGMFSNFLPVTSTIFGWLFLGQMITPLQMAGGAIVIVSSCIVMMEKGKQKQ